MTLPLRFAENDIISLTAETVRFDLAESVGPDLTLGALLSADEGETLADLTLGYGPVAGDEKLREMIAARHDVDADDVVVTAGGMQALFLLGLIVCGGGSDAVVGAPVFPNALTALEAVGTSARALSFAFDQGYRLSALRMREALRPETRLVCLASPQNPSGVALTREEVKEIVSVIEDICPAAVLLIDETYREAAYGNDPVRASMIDIDPRIVSCGSLSKCHGAPGLRIGWAVTRNRSLRAQLLLGKFNTTICNSQVDEALAVRLLGRQETILGQRRRHLSEGLDAVARMVAANADVVEWVRPDAGALCCLRLKADMFDQRGIDRFYRELGVRDVRVGHGSWFGESDRVFRLGFGLLPIADLKAGLGRLADALRATHKSADWP